MQKIGIAGFAEDWAGTTREMVSQTRRWAVTMRGIALGPWVGLTSHSDALRTATNPWITAFTTAHDRWLDLWEAQVNAAIDGVNAYAPHRTS